MRTLERPISNVTHRTIDTNEELRQICLRLREQLAMGVDLFHHYLKRERENRLRYAGTFGKTIAEIDVINLRTNLLAIILELYQKHPDDDVENLIERAKKRKQAEIEQVKIEQKRQEDNAKKEEKEASKLNIGTSKDDPTDADFSNYINMVLEAQSIYREILVLLHFDKFAAADEEVTKRYEAEKNQIHDILQRADEIRKHRIITTADIIELQALLVHARDLNSKIRGTETPETKLNDLDRSQLLSRIEEFKRSISEIQKRNKEMAENRFVQMNFDNPDFIKNEEKKLNQRKAESYDNELKKIRLLKSKVGEKKCSEICRNVDIIVTTL